MDWFSTRNTSSAHQCVRWNLLGWIFLTLGIFSGGLWAYSELGWGGYWTWDPIENSALIPWLLSTAFLCYSFTNKKYGINHFIINASIPVFIIFGTALARSGVLESLHSYGQHEMSLVFGIFLTVLFIYLGWVIKKYHLYKKWSAFTWNPSNIVTLILIITSCAIFTATIYPIISDLAIGHPVTVSESVYNRFFSIFGCMVLVIFGSSQIKRYLLRTKITTVIISVVVTALLFVLLNRPGFFVTTGMFSSVFSLLCLFISIKHRQAAPINFSGWFGMRIIYFSLILVTVGIIGSKGFSITANSILMVGQPIEIGNYIISHRGIEHKEEAVAVTVANLQVGRNGTTSTISPTLRYYGARDQYFSRALIRTTLTHDLYVLFHKYDSFNRIKLSITIYPLTIWIWIGGLGMTIGAFILYRDRF